MGFGDQFNGNAMQNPQQGMIPQQTPVTLGKMIIVKLNYEDGIEFQGLQGTTVIVATGTIYVSVDQGSQYQTEQQVLGTVYRTAKEASKAFIQNFKEEADRQGGSAVMMAPTQVCLKYDEIAAAVADKIEALGIRVDREKTRIRPTENKATKEAAQKAKEEREAAEQKRMNAELGDAEQYARDAVLFEQNVPAPDALTGAKVAQITAAFTTGTAKVEMRDPVMRMACPLQVSGVFTMDMSKFEPDYYAQKLQSTGDMVVQAINMQLLDRSDVSVPDVGKIATDLAAKAAEQLKADGLDILSVQIGRIAMDGKDKQKYDFRKKEMDRAKELSDPAKAAAFMQAQMEKARQTQLDNWKAQGLSPLMGATQMAEQMKKMMPSGQFPDGTQINAISYLKNNGFSADVIAQAEAEMAAGPGGLPSADQMAKVEPGATNGAISGFGATGQAQAALNAQPAPQAPTSQGAAAPANRPKFCMNCGKPLPPTGAFCQECGSRI